MRKAILLVLFCTMPALAQNDSIDVLHYRIELELREKEIAAAAELSIRPVVAPLESVVLDFGELTIDGVTVDGKAVVHERRENRQLVIPVHRTTLEPFRVRIRYHGMPTDGLLLRQNKHGDPSVFADNWPDRARQWIPSVDHPSDKATVEFIVTAPESFGVIANGALVEATPLEGGVKRTWWRESTPIPVYCMVIGAAEFAIVNAGAAYGTNVEYWLYPNDAEYGRQYGRVPRMVAFYSSLIGQYPYEKLALVQSSTRFGGMENASAIFIDEKRVNGEASLEGLVAHEIAHQWFGDSVTQRDWHDVWLSEGFATYFGNLFFEHADGRDAFLRRMRTDREDYFRSQRRNVYAIHDPKITEPRELLSSITYDKAAWVLHMLRGIMGDRAFFAAIRDYFTAYRERNASTGELRVIAERHHGAPLDWFFKQWIYEPGHPQLATKWTWRDGKLTFGVEQKQSGMVYRIPTTIEVRNGNVARRETVVIDERTESFEIAADRKPDSVTLDPDEWVLREVAQ
jgi:aminopeptidase N